LAGGLVVVVCNLAGGLVVVVLINLAGWLVVVFNFGDHQGYTLNVLIELLLRGEESGRIVRSCAVTEQHKPNWNVYDLKITVFWYVTRWDWYICTNVPEGLVFRVGSVFERRWFHNLHGFWLRVVFYA
jgi:hypothetical protein